MTEWRRTRFRNPAGWLVFVGVLLLAFSLWVPWLSASRTARTERRADRLAEVLLDATQGFEPPFDGFALEAILARFFLLAEQRGVRSKDIVRAAAEAAAADGGAEDAGWLLLQNKHYAFRLGPSPASVRETPSREAVPAMEVLAWPLRRAGPGHATFFYPENARRAFTRNLRNGYAGLAPESSPAAAAGHRRTGFTGHRQAIYPGNDNERWLTY
ncbi:MAG: hypothetical protein AB8H80_11610 [Planctomycetota bacterium]